MSLCSNIMSLLELIAVMSCVNCFEQCSYKGMSIRQWVFQIIAIFISMFFKVEFDLVPYTFFLVKAVVCFAYIRISYKEKFVLAGYRVLICIVVFDIVNLLVAIISYPIIVYKKIRTNTAEAEAIVIITMVVLYFGAIYLFRKGRWIISKKITMGAQVGIALLIGVIEIIFLEIRTLEYNSKEIVIYRFLALGFIFSGIILSLWIWDKKAEEKKFRELTSYAHKTREVLPSVSRVLNRIEDLTDQTAESAEILKELRAICQADMQETQKEMSNIKTFDSTGSIILNEQLERYLEEAAEQDFNLDIIVRAPVRGILEEKKIEIYKLLQVVGDLYRNAHKVVAKRKDGGMILICFGYNLEGFYEISVYDNGEMFPGYVLKHFGERGVTTGGTGHGIADILEALADNKNSFVLNQSLSEGSIFTKGISIVFDGKGRIEKS